MGYAPGANTLGDISTSALNAGVDAGISTSDLDLLNSVGATDQDIENIINGTVSLAATYAKYGVTFDAPSSSAAPAASQTSAPAAQIPSGSTLLYTASFTSFNISGNQVIAAINTALASRGMSVISSQVTATSALGTSPTSIQCTILDTIGHALVTDAKSILDSAVQGATANSLTASSLNVVAFGSQPSSSGVQPAAATPTQSAVSFLENNLAYIGLGIAALVLLNNFTGKRR